MNQLKRNGLTDAGREKLRMNAYKYRPWQHATGPRTPEGKARSAANGRSFDDKLAEIRRDLAETNRIVAEMRAMVERSRSRR